MNIWKVSFYLVVILGMASIESRAQPKSDSEIREDISGLLSIRHPDDSAEWWRSLGPSAPSIIIQMYTESENIYQKVRLVDALSWFDNPAATQFLKQLSLDSGNQVLKNAAVEALIRSQGMKEKNHIQRILKTENPHTKATAARALSTLDEPEADKVVDKMLSKEKENWVVSKVKKHRMDRDQNKKTEHSDELEDE